jgi:hypothetical protein
MKTAAVIHLLVYLTTMAAMPYAGRAASAGLAGYSALEGRFFTSSPAFDGQDDGPQFSWVAAPELRITSENKAHQYKLAPFYRYDAMDEERRHFDLREAYWRYTSDSFELLAGANKVFWGVAESQHLVDIINQTDVLEEIDQEEKLGQPMLMLGFQRDWGETQLYLMPYFRERRYPGEKGRLRTPLPVDKESRFASGADSHHPDVALRYSHYLGDWDLGGYYFYGTSREPLLRPDVQEEKLIAFYDLIHQGGLDLQYTREAWLWKFEGILREGHGDPFAAAVGGFEYTLYQVLGSTADVGLLAEYNWDGRDENDAPVTIFDNDIFIGARLSLNDSQDTNALLGTVIDLDNGSTIMSIEAERRVAASFVIAARVRLFVDIDEDDALSAFNRDDFIDISVQYHF